ncbi:Chaperone protein HscB [uncultured Gammaproteobacteria bacterium]|uniref:Fe-S protein assembly co-chaperone HscB n=1 Tax=Bathymodiolus heckerae thiotrophic gill symbiont TaxID=1052212 RepID=UPI0010B0D4A3|nr:Fe-S protein assembly co-chaperone HscB [Bathymodiolus heckerae thiotrophic gill symbiont]CAC9604959.1 Chaperone protein HscB [uncultured Gammaproteobacteria bacterium]SHN90941.1 Chaperone protein HscB [Bathymodiolus heckerae thiotrophic gill symbiont]
MQNFFELFSLTPNFNIDLTELESAYQQQVAKFHPDKFAIGTDKEKSFALQNTSLINTAYDTLKSSLLRATYLLELEGVNAFDEKDTQMDVDFLMSQIELREALEAIESSKDEVELDDFIEKISIKIKKNITDISIAFNSNFDQIKNLVRELKFYEQLNLHAKQLMDEWM